MSHLSFRISDTIKARLAHYCEQSGISITQFVRQAIKEKLDNVYANPSTSAIPSVDEREKFQLKAILETLLLNRYLVAKQDASKVDEAITKADAQIEKYFS